MELVAEAGPHGLTHRRIDRRLGYPEGTTSNYARTRRDLVRIVVEQVADVANLRPASVAAPRSVEEAVPQLVDAFEATVARGTDTRARMALTVDCVNDPVLHGLLTTRSPVRDKLVAEAQEMLDGLGVPDAYQRAVDFIALMNGLLYDRLIGNGVRGDAADPAAVLRAWLVGAGAREGGSKARRRAP